MYSDFEKFRSTFDALKERFPELQTQLGDVNERIQSHELVDISSVTMLRELLDEYSKLVTELHSAGEQFPLQSHRKSRISKTRFSHSKRSRTHARS